MDGMRHAALHAQEQHIVWQQVFMKGKNTLRAFPMSKEDPHKN